MYIDTTRIYYTAGNFASQCYNDVINNINYNDVINVRRELLQ